MTYVVRVTRHSDLGPGKTFDVRPPGGFTGIIDGETVQQRAERAAAAWRKSFPRYDVEVVEVDDEATADA